MVENKVGVIVICIYLPKMSFSESDVIFSSLVLFLVCLAFW